MRWRELEGFEKTLWICFGIIFCLVLSTPWVESVQCDAKTEGLPYRHKWSFMGGCQVQINGAWVPFQNVRFVGGKVEVEK